MAPSSSTYTTVFLRIFVALGCCVLMILTGFWALQPGDRPTTPPRSLPLGGSEVGEVHRSSSSRDSEPSLFEVALRWRNVELWGDDEIHSLPAGSAPIVWSSNGRVSGSVDGAVARVHDLPIRLEITDPRSVTYVLVAEASPGGDSALATVTAQFADRDFRWERRVRLSEAAGEAPAASEVPRLHLYLQRLVDLEVAMRYGNDAPVTGVEAYFLSRPLSPLEREEDALPTGGAGTDGQERCVVNVTRPRQALAWSSDSSLRFTSYGAGPRPLSRWRPEGIVGWPRDVPAATVIHGAAGGEGKRSRLQSVVKLGGERSLKVLVLEAGTKRPIPGARIAIPNDYDKKHVLVCDPSLTDRRGEAAVYSSVSLQGSLPLLVGHAAYKTAFVEAPIVAGEVIVELSAGQKALRVQLGGDRKLFPTISTRVEHVQLYVRNGEEVRGGLGVQGTPIDYDSAGLGLTHLPDAAVAARLVSDSSQSGVLVLPRKCDVDLRRDESPGQTETTVSLEVVSGCRCWGLHRKRSRCTSSSRSLTEAENRWASRGKCPCAPMVSASCRESSREPIACGCDPSPWTPMASGHARLGSFSGLSKWCSGTA